MERQSDGGPAGDDLGLRRPAGLVELIDEEQLAHKFELRLGEVVTHAQQHGFPAPVAIFRGRMLWDETAVDRWLDGQP